RKLFCMVDFCDAAAYVHRRCLPHPWICPWPCFSEQIIDFEYSSAIAPILKTRAGERSDVCARKLQYLSWDEIENKRIVGRYLSEIRDFRIEMNAYAMRACCGNQRVSNSLGATDCNWPPAAHSERRK